MSHVVLLSACGGTPIAMSTYQESFNFGSLGSYSTFSRDSDFASIQSVSDGTRNHIELAIERTLDSKGLQFQAIDDADVTVTYHLISRSGVELSNYNKRVNYCRGCLHSAKLNHGKSRWNMSPGSLILDVINNEKHQSVWRSVFPLGIKEDDSTALIQEKISNAVSIMLTAIPTSVNTE